MTAPQEADSQTNKALVACMQRWMALPELPSQAAHTPMLQAFQQIVELKASGGEGLGSGSA